MRKLIVIDASSVTDEVLKEAERRELPILHERELIIEGERYVLKEKPSGKKDVIRVKVEKSNDVDRVKEVSERGVSYVIVETTDWTIIPLENLVASVKGSKILATARDVKDAPALLGVLERGVDGVVIAPQNIEELNRLLEEVNRFEWITLREAEVTSVNEAGMGDRVCVDTSSILKEGEGMLVGSISNFLFLVHSENIFSEFTRPRPFRVNAGSIHSYIAAPSGKTLYLSEVEAGVELLAVNHRGRCRKVIVGRAKIERRPMVIVKAKAGDLEGSIILQKAETVALTSPEGKPLPVSQMEVGDKVLVYSTITRGRHFGVVVDEFIIEK
ncbi:MAG: 3-dehydroquinate synthase [Thermoprotei archaeon]|nr:MAG: 3-dehydroquinate synthase [Thermoprotei archaeon]